MFLFWHGDKKKRRRTKFSRGLRNIGCLLQPIGLDQGDAGRVAFAANNRCVVSRRKKWSDDRRFLIVGRNELGGTDRLHLGVRPIIIEPNNRSISVMEFDRGIQ